MTQRSIDTLLALMATLRDPLQGCPWDIAQTAASIVPFTIEEAYEVADAVANGDHDDLRDELGDLLLQVVFQARIAEEAGHFAFADVVAGLVGKLIRRHPHVFEPDGTPLPAGRRLADPAAVEAAWARIKAEERAERAARGGAVAAGPLDGVPAALPALTRAEKVSRKAAGYGFDWADARDVIAKVREEADDRGLHDALPISGGPRMVEGSLVEESLAAGSREAVAEEIGDLLFAVANLARHAGVDPEEALRRGTRKFERRFTAMAERLAAGGGGLSSSDLPAMEAAWAAVKRDGG